MPEQVFICGDGKLFVRDSTIVVVSDGRKITLPVENLSHLVWLGNGEVSSKLLQLCGKAGVRLSVFDHAGWFKGAFEPVERPVSGEVRLRQAAIVLARERRLEMAREIMAGALHNIRCVPAYHFYRGNKQLSSEVEFLQEQASLIRSATDIPVLMGIEGQSRKRYYASWKKIDPELDFGPRVRRPPNNPINCLISYLNGLTYAIVRHEIAKTHLDETLSFIHAPGTSRASLSLDVAELFKPVLTDRLIHRMVRKGEIEDGWFEQSQGVCLLSGTGRKAIAGKFSARLEDGGEGKSIRSAIFSEVLAIQRHVLGIAAYKSHRDRI